ncbi:bacterial transferase hexapeptide [Bacteroidales bacterium 6E]|nr:bacterial transferase hexapeptide [Bacteroidales bacterium 6E]
MQSIVIFIFNLLFRPNVFSSNIAIKTKVGKSSKIDSYTFIDKYTIIGDYTFIGKSTLITKSKIGNYCSIAPDVKIGLGEHDYTRISTSVRFIDHIYEDLTKNDCNIGNDVWIGAGAVILRGVTIGDGAIVGANAVVTKNIPPFSIAVGVPAKIIKYRFPESKIIRIQESNWWNYPPHIAKEIFNEIENEE